MRLDLTAQARATSLPFTDLDELEPGERAFAIEDWRGRMVSEHVSARVFAALVPQLMAAGIDPEIQAEVAAMIGEELRHARLCAAVVQALGGEPVATIDRLDEVPRHEDAPPLEALLRNILSISCLNETVAVAIIGASRDAIVHPGLHALLTSILKDEVGHARLGWRILEAHAAQLDGGLRARLSRYLVPAFRQLRERNTLDLAHRVSDRAMTLGVCDGRDATGLFLRTVEEVIVPGLEAHGLEAAPAWRLSALAA
jgi:hypothetical protein